MTLLEVTGVSSSYGGSQALFDVSLTIEQSETIAIIGANGAGKSTLLATVAGAMRPLAGEIRFGGRPIVALRAHERVALGISLVPEGRRIFPSLSVEENLRVGAYLKRPGPWNIGRVYDLFPVLGRAADRPGIALSGGEQQALAIGRGLMANPELLLLDEVSLGLAPILVRQLYETLPGITEAGTTVLLVEQDVRQALTAADRVYCLLEGRISLEGRPEELQPDQITAAYFGI